MSLLLAEGHSPPDYFWVWPFVAILLSIAILPLLRKTHHWWEENRHKLLISLVLATITLLYYGFRGYGVEVHGHQEASETRAGRDTRGRPCRHGADGAGG